MGWSREAHVLHVTMGRGTGRMGSGHLSLPCHTPTIGSSQHKCRHGILGIIAFYSGSGECCCWDKSEPHFLLLKSMSFFFWSSEKDMGFGMDFGKKWGERSFPHMPIPGTSKIHCCFWELQFTEHLAITQLLPPPTLAQLLPPPEVGAGVWRVRRYCPRHILMPLSFI